MIKKIKNGFSILKRVENNIKIAKTLFTLTSQHISNRNVHTSLTAEQNSFVSNLFDGLITNKRADLAKSITLIETTHPVKKLQAQEFLNKVLKYLKESQSKNLKKCLRVGKCALFFDDYHM
jgi:hypothetical protein